MSREIQRDLATFTVLSEGQQLPPEVGVAMLAVRHAVNKIPMAKLVLFDGDIATGTFDLSESELFLPGKVITINAGYHSEEETIFEGIIIKHGLDIHANKASRLILELRDIAVKMTVGRKSNYYAELTDSELIEELIGKYSDLEAEVESTSLLHPEIVQYHCTDWDLLLSRAERNGKIVLLESGKIEVKKPGVDADEKETLVYGENVVDFEAQMDVRQQYKATKASSWDFIRNEVNEKEGSSEISGLMGNLSTDELADVIGLEAFQMTHGGGLKDEELQAWTDSSFMRSHLSRIQGKIKILGDFSIKVGDMVKLDSFGSRFNGKAFVSMVYHEISPSQKWFTHLGLGLDSKYASELYDDIVETPASGVLPAIQGVHIGLVTALVDDPEGEFRIKVKLPIISNEEEGVWARFASPDAGDSRGIFFRPEIDDEVVVSFINQDPRFPVILGTLHSSNRPAPVDIKEENIEKAIVTREQLKILFNEEEKSISLETPGGNKVTLSDDAESIELEDSHGNKVSMNSDGISLESQADILLKASGDVKIEGTNVEAAAQAQFKAEGSSGAELSTGGQAVISGSVVQIN